MTQAERLLRVFEGSGHAHGKTTVGRIGRGGKAEAKSMMIRGPMTVDMVQEHINGGQGYGAVPITAENMVKFGAMDIDTYNLDLAALNKKIRDAKLPMLLCRSKSGGAHVYLFLDDWYPASLIREYLTEISHRVWASPAARSSRSRTKSCPSAATSAASSTCPTTTRTRRRATASTRTGRR